MPAVVVDHFHAIRLANLVVDQVRRRVQQATLGHRGRKRDPLYGICMTRPTWRSASAWRPCSSRSSPFLGTRAAPASTRPRQKRPARQRKSGLILENGEWVWQDLNLRPRRCK
jgi:hypothetical protein